MKPSMFCKLFIKTLKVITIAFMAYTLVVLVFGMPYAILTGGEDNFVSLIAISSPPLALLLFVVYGVENMEQDGKKILLRWPKSKLFWMWVGFICLPILFNGASIILENMGWYQTGAYIFKIRYYTLLVLVIGVFMSIVHLITAD